MFAFGVLSIYIYIMPVFTHILHLKSIIAMFSFNVLQNSHRSIFISFATIVQNVQFSS